MLSSNVAPGAAAASERVLIVGWDGAPYQLVRDMLESGDLPNLESIVEDGYFGPLETIPYVMSSCAWSTFLTGKNAGKHGIYDFYASDFRGDSYFREPINASARDSRDLGDVLGNHGLSLGRVNVPLTYPAREVNGFTVTGMLTPSKDAEGFCYPPDFLDGFEELDRYRIDSGEGKDADKDEFLADIDAVVEGRMELVVYALENSSDLDVYFAVFTAPDRLSHYYWHFEDETHPFRKNESPEDLERYNDVVRDLFRDLDAKLGELVERFRAKYDDPMVAVVSDHGMKSLKRVFHVNKWLARNGYLTFKDEFDGSAVDDDAEEILDDRVEYIFGKVDWENTVAYAMGKRGAIYVNQEGREPQGIVAPDDREDVIADLEADLCEVVDPDTGENIVEEVQTREQLFHGNHVDEAPDILLRLSEGYYPFGYAFELEKPALVSTNDWPDMPFVTGIEDGDGIFAVAGDKIDPDCESVDVGLVDFAPTLLHYLGLLIPDDMDGEVPLSLFRGEHADPDAVEYAAAAEAESQDDDLSSEDEETVKERLEDLGYL
jgi:predicted AlkP superfamily phosphohydrolase/phosphomutase